MYKIRLYVVPEQEESSEETKMEESDDDNRTTTFHRRNSRRVFNSPTKTRRMSDPKFRQLRAKDVPKLESFQSSKAVFASPRIAWFAMHLEDKLSTDRRTNIRKPAVPVRHHTTCLSSVENRPGVSASENKKLRVSRGLLGLGETCELSANVGDQKVNWSCEKKESSIVRQTTDEFYGKLSYLLLLFSFLSKIESERTVFLN